MSASTSPRVFGRWSREPANRRAAVRDCAGDLWARCGWRWYLQHDDWAILPGSRGLFWRQLRRLAPLTEESAP